MFSILLASGESSSRGKIFNEGDHLQPWFKIQELEVAREFTQQSPECSDVLEKVIVYRLLERYIVGLPYIIPSPGTHGEVKVARLSTPS